MGIPTDGQYYFMRMLEVRRRFEWCKIRGSLDGWLELWNSIDDNEKEHFNKIFNLVNDFITEMDDIMS